MNETQTITKVFQSFLEYGEDNLISHRELREKAGGLTANKWIMDMECQGFTFDSMAGIGDLHVVIAMRKAIY